MCGWVKAIVKLYPIFGGMHIYVPADVMVARFDPLTAIFEATLIRRLL